MSTKTRARTMVKDRPTLLKVLDKLGYTWMEGDNLHTSKAFGAASEKVDILLTGYKKTGPSKSLEAIGMKKTDTGEYEAVGDFYHLNDADGNPIRNANGFQTKVNRIYAYSKAVEALQSKGFGQCVENPEGKADASGAIKATYRLTNPALAGLS